MTNGSPPAERALAEIDRIYGIGSRGDGARRIAWTDELESALEWFAERCRDAGLGVSRDAAGNLLAKWNCGDGKAVLVGSHLDSVPQGGAFDGVLGVVSGLEAIRRLRERGVEPQRPIWLAAFMDEEGVRFGVDFFGSRSFVGDDLRELAARADPDGVALAEAMRGQGFAIEASTEAAAVDEVAAYVELHAELGPELQRAGVPLGAITEIFGQSLLRVALLGSADHAAVPLEERRDALLGASAIAVRVADRAAEVGDYVATVGTMRPQPGAPNAVAGRCELSIDMRAGKPEALRSATAGAREIVAEEARGHRLEAEVIEAVNVAPVAVDRSVLRIVIESCERLGLGCVEMPSRTAHDAMLLAPHVPTGMIFVRSAPIGHSPDEDCRSEDVDAGVEALAETLVRLCAA